MRIEDSLLEKITEKKLRDMELKRELTTNDEGRFSVLEYCEKERVYTFVVGCPSFEYAKAAADLLTSFAREMNENTLTKLMESDVNYYVYNPKGEMVYVGDEDEIPDTMN